ncbi:MAG: outer membrane beta-barrel protein [Marinoscillum sp.]
MTGRENSEEQFENQWRDAFDQFEEEAPKQVWSEIDRELTYSDLSSYKSKVVYYRWVAAVVLLMAASIVMLQYYSFKDNIQYVSYSDNSMEEGPVIENTVKLMIPLEVKSKELSGVSNFLSTIGDSFGLASKSEEETIESTESFFTSQIVMHEVNSLRPTNEIITTHQDKYLYYLPVYNFKKQRKKAESSKYYAGLGVGSNSFNPNYQGGATNSLSDNLAFSPTAYSAVRDEASNTIAPNMREDMASGESISLGLNFGVKLGNRWTLESGVQYARAEAITKTNMVVETTTFQEVIPATVQGKNIPAFESALNNETVVEYDYRDVNMNNQFEFTSVPLKAGYLILNNKFKLEVNAGLIANIYMGNKLTSNDDNVADLTIGPGSTSPYRDLSFSGLAGVEMGYQFMKDFDIIIEPNYRQSINSLTKDNSSFKTNPSGFGLMTGLRYNF